MRRCWHCKKYRNADEFYHDKAHVDGLKSICKVCDTPYYREYLKQYYLDHRDELLPKHRVSAIKSYHRRKALGVI